MKLCSLSVLDQWGFLLLGAALTASSLISVDLSQATCREIDDELRTRPNYCNLSLPVAFGTYKCSSGPNGWVTIDVTPIVGNGQSINIAVGPRHCQKYAALFSQRFTRISGTILLAMCNDSDSWMQRVTLNANGSLRQLDNMSFSSIDDCDRQADQINNAQ